MPVVRLLITTPLHPTEDEGKVVQAIQNIFPDARVDIGERELTAESSGTDRLESLLCDQRIRGAARAVLLRGRKGKLICFSLNKQAAFMGKISFGLASPPLGNIDVTAETDDPEGLIDSLAPPRPRRFSSGKNETQETGEEPEIKRVE